jgi:transcription termination/antitermination protein NusG
MEEFLSTQVLNSRFEDNQLVPAADVNEQLLPWYAIRVRSKFEKLASVALRAKGFEEFLPVYRTRRQWSDRIKAVDCPLFPGYLFCRLAIEKGIMPIVTTPGFISILGTGNSPIEVPDAEINAIQVALRSGIPAQPSPHVTVGSRVVIERGPLASVEGIVLNIGDKLKLIVSITLLQRSLAVEIDREWLRPVQIGADGIAHAGIRV